MIASALAVELTVGLLHHPLGSCAPSDDATSTAASPFGLLPHQIRGFIATFSHMLVSEDVRGWGMRGILCLSC